MNWLDIVIIVVIAIATLLGLRTGIIKAVLSMAGLVVGIILAGRYYAPISEQLSFIPQTNVANIVAYAIILIGVMVVAIVAANLLKWAVSIVMLGWVNRLGGALFGLALGAILCGALLAICIKLSQMQGPISESSLAPILLNQFPLVLALLPNNFEAVRSFFQ